MNENANAIMRAIDAMLHPASNRVQPKAMVNLVGVGIDGSETLMAAGFSSSGSADTEDMIRTACEIAHEAARVTGAIGMREIALDISTADGAAPVRVSIPTARPSGSPFLLLGY